jgi:hypothetical protein
MISCRTCRFVGVCRPLFEGLLGDECKEDEEVGSCGCEEISISGAE